ncbi:unnamed protein product, partial [Meganyctiphanes norvegica]
DKLFDEFWASEVDLMESPPTFCPRKSLEEVMGCTKQEGCPVHQDDECGNGQDDPDNPQTREQINKRLDALFASVKEAYEESEENKVHFIKKKGQKANSDGTYSCIVCGYKVGTSQALKMHMRQHMIKKKTKKSSKKKPSFHCDECGFGCRYKTQLVEHKRIHTGERPYECEVCGFRFSHKCAYKKHKFSHSGEKPFECDRCGSRFTLYNSLKQHVLTHDGEKPFICSICGHAVTRKSNLKIHMMTHTGNVPSHFPCSLCNVVCKRERYLKKHMLTHTSGGKKLVHKQELEVTTADTYSISTTFASL